MPPLHQSLPNALTYFQHNAQNLSYQYDNVLREEVDWLDQSIYELIISDTESLLFDKDRLLSLSVSHKKYIHDKLRRENIQFRTIQHEAVVYDSSQLLNSANDILTRVS